MFNKSQYDGALEAYDAAYKCRPAATLLRNAFIVACNMRDKVEAWSYWKQLSPAPQTQSLGACVSHGITAVLSAP
jgi:hypothetical protein